MCALTLSRMGMKALPYLAGVALISGAALPSTVTALSPRDKGELVEVANKVLDRFVDQVFAPALVQVRRVEWSSSGQTYTEAMAKRDRQQAYLLAATVLVWHKAVDKGIALASRADRRAAADPRARAAEEFERSWAMFAGALSGMSRRWPIDKRHARLVADLERRFGAHEAFRSEASRVEPKTPGRRCRLDLKGGLDDLIRIVDSEDYRKYKVAHDNRDWSKRSVKDELIPMVVAAPCVAYFELSERGNVREALSTLSDAIEVSELLRIPSEGSLDQADRLSEVLKPLLGMVAFLGWLGAGMP